MLYGGDILQAMDARKRFGPSVMAPGNGGSEGSSSIPFLTGEWNPMYERAACLVYFSMLAYEIHIMLALELQDACILVYFYYS